MVATMMEVRHSLTWLDGRIFRKNQLLHCFNFNFSLNKGIAVWTPSLMIIVLIVSVMKLELNIQLVVGEVEPLGELPHGEQEVPLGEVLPGGVPLGGEQEVPLGEQEVPLEEL